jgi:3'(2'), 5'-bisphosphate nucleotidase
MELTTQEGLAKIAIHAAWVAGQEILRIYNKQNFGIEYKSDNSPITQADKAAQNKITQLLKPTEIPIISEEAVVAEFPERSTWTTCWIIDPLDGTKEFIKRNGEFTVNIAVVENGKPIIGVIYAPVLHNIYFAMNKIAYKVMNVQTKYSPEEFQQFITQNQKQIPINKNNRSYRLLASRSHNDTQTKLFIDRLLLKNPDMETVFVGSSLKFCMIATGRADIYPRFTKSMEWDTAAGHAILDAAGGKVVDSITGETLLYNKESLVNPGFIASI